MRLLKLTILPGFILSQLVGNYCLAQSGMGEILDNEIAADADLSVLEAEAKSIDTISKGIALSLAVCEGIDLCTPNVNRAELRQFIDALDARIGSLTQRYETSDSTELENVLIAYADAKENYSQYLDKLGTMVVEEESPSGGLFGDDDFLQDFGAPRGVDPEIEALFSNDDEVLLDDEDVEGDPAGAPVPAE